MNEKDMIFGKSNSIWWKINQFELVSKVEYFIKVIELIPFIYIKLKGGYGLVQNCIFYILHCKCNFV